MTTSLTDAMLTLRGNLGPCDTWPEDVAAACRVIDDFIAGRAEPNPMPAPALGMRVWVEEPEVDRLTLAAHVLLRALDAHEDATDAISGDAYHPDHQEDVYGAKCDLRDVLNALTATEKP